MNGIIRKIFTEIKRFSCTTSSKIRRAFGWPPDLDCWLSTHQNIANNIKWQYTFQTSAYDVPEAVKIAWPNWTQYQKNALQQAFSDSWNWSRQSNRFQNLNETLVYPPVNMSETLMNDTGNPSVKVSEPYAWDFFLRWIAQNLVAEIEGHFPWSILNHSDEALQVLFDSNAMMSRDGSNIRFTLCPGNPGHGNYVKRKDNLGTSLIAPPRFTYAFLVNNALIGTTRIDTIDKVLQWVSNNLIHFYGGYEYINMQAHWQYRGCPPITSIIQGTTTTSTTPPQFGHWTAGCHGTVGFLRNVLRAANIPVQIMVICGHGQAYFMTEGLYLDHGDNPYNLNFIASGATVLQLLINQATHNSWFGNSTDNHTDTYSCDHIGAQVAILAGP